MATRYAKPLKVSDPDGNRIVAQITRVGETVLIEVPYTEVVKKDDPPFARNGVVRFSVPRQGYTETLAVLTKYYEDLFLKGMADEDIYTSLGAKPTKRRVKKSNPPRATIDVEGKGRDSGLHSGARGDESPKSARRGRSSKSEVASGDDSGPEGSGSKGD